MEDVTELISKVSQELGPDASDEEISKKVFEAVEALPQPYLEGADFDPSWWTGGNLLRFAHR